MAQGQPQGVVPPPPGVTPNFDYSDPWLFAANLAIISVGLVLATASLILRIYTRSHIMHEFGWDDVSIILAWAFSVAIQSVCIYGYKHSGVGIHLWNVTGDLMASFQKILLVATVLYVPALAFAKFSLIVLYYRIANKNTTFKWALYTLAAIVCGYTIAIILALIFACHPIAKSWDITIKHGHCIDRNGLYMATAVTNTATDLALILLPIPVVVRLRMPRMQKVGTILLFTVGCATFVTSILRLATLVQFQSSKDITHDLAWPEIWINIESNLIVICPCLPFLRQFFRHHRPRWLSEATILSSSFTTGSGSRGSRRYGSFRLQQDEVALANTSSNGSTSGDHNEHESRIFKDVQWHVIEERAGVGGPTAFSGAPWKSS